MSTGGVARGGLFLFIGSIVSAIIGYAYWFLISVFSGAEVIGIASSVSSLAVLVASIVPLGIPLGVQRFLGRNFSQRNIEGLNTYFWSSFTFTFIACLISAIVFWCVGLLGTSFIGFSGSMLFSTGLMIFLSFGIAMSAFLTSAVKTEYAAVSLVVSGIIRLCVGVFLVYEGLGWLGAVMGLIFESVSVLVLMLFFTLRELKRMGGVQVNLSFKATRESVQAGFASWFPWIIALLGQQLSFLVVFGYQGSFEAGTYYIAYTVFAMVYMVPSSFTAILFPILSGVSDDSKSGEMTWRVLRLCLAITCPSTAFLVLYSAFPLSLMPGQYVQAAPTLCLLALSTIPLTFLSAVISLVYASGSYGKVLGIGFAQTVPRVILYFLLVPIYGGLGAALSFLIGTVIGLVAAAYVSKRIHFKVSLRKIGVVISVPFTAILLCFLMGFNWLVGGIVILLASVLCYGRLGVVERKDLAQIARGFASDKTVAKARERLHWLLRIIYGK